ncbi:MULTISPECIES: ArsR/SmtB family transcription factor [Gordonia]|uniref:Putative ArsR family transcriptional regulator n=1 Tax=Gordonia malaquae NBRC 108250 TaxID=1223542 RepID=M3UNV4_GORML|nr:metalloregulator ArsR/SmtB family transcription factor [Gordonia malaquae]GAC81890.1 putative ArsR family transcriptional regulator [Gordonia malaquae NBRC 108250]SEE21205.1 Helix-turn-helix domain-containing protein [Gordonia malaquae]
MDAFEALADPVRRSLLTRLRDGPARVVDLASDHDISRPAISKHLRLLTEAGLVDASTSGRERHYRLTVEGITPVREFLDSLRPPAPLIPEHVLDGLDLEVRRTSRERRESDADRKENTA